jgi:SAM-dependent methyltransferase
VLDTITRSPLYSGHLQIIYGVLRPEVSRISVNSRRKEIPAMKLTVTGENLIERLLIAFGVVPVTLVDTHMSFMRARAIMVGVKLGIFEALASGAMTAADVTSRCGTSLAGTEKLMNALVGCGYLRFARGGYELSPVARKWATSDSPHTLRDKVLFEFIEWTLVENFEDFVRTGQPLDIHSRASEEEWGLYQRGMRALSGLVAPEIVRRTPMPGGASAMLDIGGSHGYISVAMCRRYANLRAEILDLPAAVAHAAPILAKERMGNRVVHRAGDALTDDFGTNQWDLVFVSQLLHHFNETTNREFARRAARALKPGGVFVILELTRPSSPQDVGQVGALLDLYFALTSQSGTWSVEEMSDWQREAGLASQKPIRLRTMPGAVEIVAVKPR